MELLEIATNSINKILTIIVILLIGFIIAKLCGKIIKRVFHETEIDIILKTAGLPPLTNSIAMLLESTIIFGTILIILERLGLAILAAGILITLIGLFILATILIGFRDAVPNLFAGFYIQSALKKKFKTQIKIGNTSGKLDNIRPFDSVILNGEDEIHLPHTYSAKHLK